MVQNCIYHDPSLAEHRSLRHFAIAERAQMSRFVQSTETGTQDNAYRLAGFSSQIDTDAMPAGSSGEPAMAIGYHSGHGATGVAAIASGELKRLSCGSKHVMKLPDWTSSAQISYPRTLSFHPLTRFAHQGPGIAVLGFIRPSVAALPAQLSLVD